ncbi:MAG: phosphotransferase, partial [Pseudomonadales bacterium]|nr:phosphotransferase [Pseudomonadales bacterium]
EHNFFLLMEDVSSYRMGSQVEGATLEECELCVDFLANLHASFWNQLSDVEWLPNMSGSDNATNMALGCEAGWPQLQEIFGEFVPDNIEAMRERYLAAIPTLQAKLDQHPKTLIHGDFRMDNMLFGQAPEHDALLVVDFQGPLKGNGIHDVAYLLSHSAKTDVRREHERDLIERYANGLITAGIKHYSVEKAWNDYRVGVLYSWTVAVVIAGTMDPANDRGFAWMSKMVERNGLAINDLNCLDLLD